MEQDRYRAAGRPGLSAATFRYRSASEFVPCVSLVSNRSIDSNIMKSIVLISLMPYISSLRWLLHCMLDDQANQLNTNTMGGQPSLVTLNQNNPRQIGRVDAQTTGLCANIDCNSVRTLVCWCLHFPHHISWIKSSRT